MRLIVMRVSQFNKTGFTAIAALCIHFDKKSYSICSKCLYENHYTTIMYRVTGLN